MDKCYACVKDKKCAIDNIDCIYCTPGGYCKITTEVNFKKAFKEDETRNDDHEGLLEYYGITDWGEFW